MIGPIDLHLSPAPHFKRSTNCHRNSESVLPISADITPCSAFATNRTARLEDLKNAFLKSQVFWDVAICGRASRSRRFEEY